MASWDFTVDSEKQMDIADKLSTAADDFDTKVSLLYGQIDSMENNSWIGEDYNAFHTGTHNYEGALKDLSNGFRMFGEHFKLMSSGTDTLATELISIIQNMTGTITAGNSNGDGTSSSSNYGNDDPLLYRDSTWGDDYESDSNSSSPSTSYGADEEPTHGGGSHRNENSDPTVRDEPNSDPTTKAEFDSDNTTSSSENSSSKTITRGTVVSLGNGNYNYYGTTKGGNNLYTDANQDLYYEDENGNAVNVTRQQYAGGTNYNTVNFNVKDIGTSQNIQGRNVPIILNVNGESVGYGSNANTNITSSVVYEDSNVGPSIVGDVQGNPTGTVYRVGATNMNVADTSSNIVVPKQETEFMSAINEHKDIKLPPNATLKYDPWGIWNTKTVTNGRNDVYLRYDAGTGLYYVADESGTYSTTQTGYDPSVLTNGDSSLKFN